ncbi:hypothetical protein [Pedobacter montanisoli]|uniref:Uncharacterized protein n=1 Tax=Pedobacter montanisoli TaxID=2923277 RepID=A0ABS9ZXT1_9SPHI|nr:hypothetical protein [Pedobacter montanisoli]MCJ0743139.1 hypothetical protein [Pedobacter montanisoli]
MLKNFVRLLCLTGLILVWGSFAKAQSQLTPGNLALLNKLQISLADISDSTFNIENDEGKIAQNTHFVKELVKALKTPHSYAFNFDSLKNISILKAPNNSFKIFTWSLALSNGTYKFYGTIQLPTKDGQLKLVPLNDATSQISDPDAITNAKNWYGARYYEIMPVSSYNNQPSYFILLGWKGYTNKTTQKVIEVLTLDKDEAIFGKKIFETAVNSNTLKNRVIFEYSSKNSMTLTYNRSVSMIVFDHLAPYEPSMKDQFEYYVSDSSFDGYIINYNRFKLKENITLKNDPSVQDEHYKPPVKATTLLKKAN